MKAIGLTCGVGSMLIGARSAGFKVEGNIEWRPYYHTGTFEKNFGAFMVKDLSQANFSKDITLAMGHPECGNYSSLRTSAPKFDDPGDIPLFIKMIQAIRPGYFVMDNLPKSLIAVPIQRYATELKDYDLFPEWISNFHYGNTQINRRRFFLIGAKREKKFVFQPGEFAHDRRLRDVIGDLPLREDIFEINHIHWKKSDVVRAGWLAHHLDLHRKNKKITYAEFIRHFKDWPSGKLLTYRNLKGELKDKPGFCKVGLDRYSYVLTGGGSGGSDNHYREDTGLPLTQRERARIQGCKDDFIFYPLEFMDTPKMYAYVFKQIGKFMPIEFCEYVATQIWSHENRLEWKRSTMNRFPASNSFVDEAKQALCQERKIKSEETCEACWILVCPMRHRTVFNLPPVSTPVHDRTGLKNTPIKPYGEPPKKQGKRTDSSKPLTRSTEDIGPTNTPVHVRSSLEVLPIISYKSDEDIRLKPSPISVEQIYLKEDSLPADYIGRSKYADKYRGQLIRLDGSFYSRLDKNKYYSDMEKTVHPAKTPIHIARWAIQEFTKKNDWVLDPMVGTGTTMVEALRLARNAVGMEIEFISLVRENVRINNPFQKSWEIFHGDARRIEECIGKKRFDLIVNNPPYSGDERQYDMASRVKEKWDQKRIEYDPRYKNLAFLKENKEYWDTLEDIYTQCIDRLKKGGWFVIAVKDMMKNKRPFRLHEMIGDLLSRYLEYQFMAVLKHYPPTLHLNTYEKKFGVPPPLYQTILTFQKKG